MITATRIVCSKTPRKSQQKRKKLKKFIKDVKSKNKNEPEFVQAVTEVAESVFPHLDENMEKMKIMERLVEPERIITFRVTWTDDDGIVQINRGYRVEFSSSIGPYKGGLRFHPTVNISILKFLGFEQVLKNSLTSLNLGGGKGGSDFDPKGKSDNEVMRFCQAFMTEMSRHIGPNTDIPAGDIGVGSREIGFMFGQYKKLQNEFTGTFTGKDISCGGSHLRPEATGYGLVYFVQNMLERVDETISDKTVVISGSGNVAQFTCEKALLLGAKVVTMSDSSGYIFDPDGFTLQKLDFIKVLKNEKRGRIVEYTEVFKDSSFHPNKKPWKVACDIALPCATQNEIDAEDAVDLISNKVQLVAEGANMPSSADAVKQFQSAGVLFAPGKATNSGGVAVSGLEMQQNSLFESYSREEVDLKLQHIMLKVHQICVENGECDGNIDYVQGANLGGLKKVAQSMISQGIC